MSSISATRGGVASPPPPGPAHGTPGRARPPPGTGPAPRRLGHVSPRRGEAAGEVVAPSSPALHLARLRAAVGIAAAPPAPRQRTATTPLPAVGGGRPGGGIGRASAPRATRPARAAGAGGEPAAACPPLRPRRRPARPRRGGSALV